MRDGKITNAAMVLLGKPESADLFETPPTVMWRLYHEDGTVRDYELFEIPFINVADRVLEKIRFLIYRYLPNPKSLFTSEVFQYDSWSLRELISNCIAHSNYQSGGRIYINEWVDYLTITNPGIFIPGSIREVLRPGYNPPYYRNALLASAMANFRMIDTATSGIKKVFLIQKERFFPMPDYEMVQSYQVTVTVYGKILNARYTHILFDHPELDLETVFLLDQIQKGKTITDPDREKLREQKLIRIEDQHIYLDNPERYSDNVRGIKDSEDEKEDDNGGIKDSEGKKEDDNRGIKGSEGKKEGEGRGIKDSEGKKKDENRGIKGIEDDALQMILSSSEIHMIEILKEQPEISIVKLADAMKLSYKGTRIILDRLKSKGVINREGGRKYGKWIVQCPTRE